MAKANPHKNFKGQVGISLNGQSLRLQWTYQGKRYALSPGLHDTPENRVFAEKIAKEIEIDIAMGFFDPTLDKYRPASATHRAKPSADKKEISAIELFNKYLEFRRNDLALGTQKKYEILGRQIVALLGNKSANVDIDDAIKVKNWMGKTLKSATAKDKICILHAAWAWGIKRKLIQDNPWEEIKFKQEIKERPNPFTEAEVRRIILEFKENEPHYADFVAFRFFTGMRSGELAALKWSDVFIDQKYIRIYTSFNSSTQEMKPVKRNKVRTVHLSRSALSILTERKSAQNPQPDQLVFAAKKGGYISARNFSKREWKNALSRLGIDYRRPYKTRHTTISHALKSGMSPVDIASVVGNTPKTIYQDYAGQIENAVLPDLYDQKSPDNYAQAIELNQE